MTRIGGTYHDVDEADDVAGLERRSPRGLAEVGGVGEAVRGRVLAEQVFFFVHSCFVTVFFLACLSLFFFFVSCRNFQLSFLFNLSSG